MVLRNIGVMWRIKHQTDYFQSSLKYVSAPGKIHSSRKAPVVLSPQGDARRSKRFVVCLLFEKSCFAMAAGLIELITLLEKMVLHTQFKS